VVHSERVLISYKDLRKKKGNVRMLKTFSFPISHLNLVFRKAHDSAKAVKTWMADLHKA
jgi:hypothetical protein